jgi:FKBP-type peptidyl-prolyl cis-trans isomerase SlyD
MRARFSAAVLGVAVFRMFLSAGATAAEPSKDDKVVKDGMVISLEYTLIGQDGKVMESHRGKEPLKYIQGEKTGMPPGLEKELVGMKVGQEKHVRLENAYGAVNPQAFQEIPKKQIPPSELKQIKVGSMVPLTTPNGQEISAPVSEIKEKTIVVNLNHPMAGKTLVWVVKVLDIQPPPPPQAAEPAEPAPPGKPPQGGR